MFLIPALVGQKLVDLFDVQVQSGMVYNLRPCFKEKKKGLFSDDGYVM